jgi:hypothetical protein
MFAWVMEEAAEAVRATMVAEFVRNGVETDHWIVPVQSDGARVVDP